jgi:hypothetical protein
VRAAAALLHGSLRRVCVDASKAVCRAHDGEKRQVLACMCVWKGSASARRGGGGGRVAEGVLFAALQSAARGAARPTRSASRACHDPAHPTPHCAQLQREVHVETPHTRHHTARRLNVKFTDRMKRIKIPLPPTDEKKKVRARCLLRVFCCVCFVSCLCYTALARACVCVCMCVCVVVCVCVCACVCVCVCA